MTTDRLVIINARLLTLKGGLRRGVDAMNNLGAITNATVTISAGVIQSIAETLPASSPDDTHFGSAKVIDARGRVLMPGFVDAHTHAVWAGDRLDEWDMKRRGVAYLDILKAGGGIMSTVRAVRNASQAQLTESLRTRLDVMLREGTTTVEIKSGYGLSTNDELKMLRAIHDAARTWPGSVVPTALLGHAIDPEQIDFIKRTTHETLDAIHSEFPGIAIDAYCENGAWSLEQCTGLFERARSLGHPIRVHSDQFTPLGMTQWAVANGMLSVDHLESTPSSVLKDLAHSDTFGVMLPCTGFHTDSRYANARDFIIDNGALVLASNCNPGSSPCSSIPMVIAVATRFLRLTPAQAISACTANAAALLARQSPSLPRVGVIEPGARADLALLRHSDERLLAYEFGGNPVDVVIARGRVVATSTTLTDDAGGTP